jgi:hypothetical protein
MKTPKLIAGILLAAVCAFLMAGLLDRKNDAQPASTHQPREVQYAFPVYPSLAALLADGPTPIQFGAALIRGGSTNYDGSGGFLLWSGTALTTTNANTVFAVPGITNSSGTLVGRWFALNTNAPPVP